MISRPALRRRGAGLDDVGDDLGDAELDGGLHGAVEVDDGGVDAVVGEVLGDDALVGGGDRHARRSRSTPLAVPGLVA